MEYDQTNVNEGVDDSESLTGDELNVLLDLILGNKMEFTQVFLRQRGLPFSGKLSQLRDRLDGYLANNDISVNDLIALLNNIEGWGRQHIYFFRVPDNLIDEWRDETASIQRLHEAGLTDIINRQRVLLLPQDIQLCEVQLTADKLRFIWVERRYWEERVSEEDRQEGDLILRAYRPRTERGVVTFEMDLVSGIAMLMIRQLPSGTKYSEIRDRFLANLEPFLDIRQLQPIRVSPAITPLEQSGLVRRRQLAYASRGGSRVQLSSAGRNSDLLQDRDIQGIATPLRANTAGSDANFYWLVNDELPRELRSRIYGEDQRVAIFGQHAETAVRYVLGCIIQNC